MKNVKFYYWLPRVLCILAIILVSIFALDSFSGDESLFKQLGNFLIHMIPSFVLIALLVLAWKYEVSGGIIFILLGLGFIPN